jgi:hypothetical protein
MTLRTVYLSMNNYRGIGLATVFASSLSCGDPARPPDLPATVTSVEILATQTWLPLQQSLQLSVVLTDSSGDILQQVPVTWMSSHPDVAAVDAHGLLVGVKSGLTRVSATAGPVSDTLVFSVDADGPASGATWTCSDSFVPGVPPARRLAFEVEATATVPLVSIEDLLVPMLVDRGADIIHRYQNFPLVRVMLDRDSIAGVRGAYFNATSRAGPLFRGVVNPDEARGSILILFTGDSTPITAEILRHGGQVIQILSITPIIIAEVPDSAVPYVQGVAGVVGAIEYDYSSCHGI